MPVLKAIRPFAFWPPQLILLLLVWTSLSDEGQFINVITTINAWVIGSFSTLFTGSAFFLLIMCLGIYLSPLRNIRIGGNGATRVYSPFRWFAVSLTTVIAIGILFWSVAEPVLHFNQPPLFSGAAPRSDDAARFAFSTLLVHWGPAPYAIYTVAGLGFALAHYNFNGPFASRTLLAPLIGARIHGRGGQLIDAVVLLAAVVGMAAALTAGTLLIGGGVERTPLNSFQSESSAVVYASVISLILGSALLSSYTGLTRGIQVLARINTMLFLAALGGVLAIGPLQSIWAIASGGLMDYLVEFVPRHLLWHVQEDWPGWWTIAFFASWFAWAPVSCLFLGKIARGYTVGQFIFVNLVLPSLFALLWFAAFGGYAIDFDMAQQGELFKTYQQSGLGAVVYPLFEAIGGGTLIVIAFVLIAVISFVTATDSNAEVIGGLSVHSNANLGRGKTLAIKGLWIGIIGLLAWLSTSYLGEQGIKMMANLAGLPGLVIVDLSAIALLVSLWRIRRQQD